MKILYAPTMLKTQNISEQNVLDGYHMMLIDALVQNESVSQVLCLMDSDQKLAVGEWINSTKCNFITHLTEASDTALMVTDLANTAFAYALFYKKPVIYFLPGFTGVDIAEQKDQLFMLLNRFCYFCHSFVQLRETIEDMPAVWEKKRSALEKFVDGALI